MPYELNHICASYGKKQVLTDVSFAVREREFLAIMGPNGSGKSTLLKVLAGQKDVSSGVLQLKGKDIRDFFRRELALHVAFMPQIFSGAENWTVRELVACGRFPHRGKTDRAADAAAVEQALESVHLADFGDRELGTLSGGERQKARVALTLAQGSDVLLLDEPAAFLDPSARMEIAELLRRLCTDRGLTVIAILHDLDLASRYADRIAMLKEGILYGIGTPGEVLTSDSLGQVFGIAGTFVTLPDGGKICVPLSLK